MKLYKATTIGDLQRNGKDINKRLESLEETVLQTNEKHENWIRILISLIIICLGLCLFMFNDMFNEMDAINRKLEELQRVQEVSQVEDFLLACDTFYSTRVDNTYCRSIRFIIANSISFPPENTTLIENL